MHQRTRRSPARFLAPLALIAVIVAFLAIVSGSGNSGTSTSSDSSSTTPAATSAATAAKKKKTTTTVKKKTAAGKRFYTVQTGDTLGAIASKTGISLQTIQSLNPAVDPHAMTTGQKIRLR